MEAGGIEPPYRDGLEQVSTCIVDLLNFAADDSDRQDSSLASSTVFSSATGPAAAADQPTIVVQHY